MRLFTPDDVAPVDPLRPFGWYVGRVVASWNGDGRNMTLTERFAYFDPEGNEWDAPAGSVVDGASIPRIAWSAIGGPFEGLYRDASVIHDVACDRRTALSSDEVHRAFYWAMRASNVQPIQAKVMYAAVYHFGPQWVMVASADPSMVWMTPHYLTDEQFQDLSSEIARREVEGAPMAFAEIESYRKPLGAPPPGWV